MTRKADWETLLVDYLAKIKDKPHGYGDLDCMMFVAGAARTITGKDPARGHRGKYKTEKGAARYLRKLGFKNMKEMLDSIFEEKPLSFVQRGDVVMRKDGIPGIAMGEYALFVGQDGEAEGLIREPISNVTKAWAV